MDEEKLILLVQTYPELWDTSHAFYRDQQRKDAIWEEIAKNNFLNKTGDDCKKKWFTLRDGYRRSLNKRKTVTGQASNKIKPYRFEQQMQFLRPCFDERSQLTNFDSSSDCDNNEDEEDTLPEDLATETRETLNPSVASPPLSSPSASVYSSKGSNSSGTSSVRKTTKQAPVRAAEVLQTYLEKKPPSIREDHLSAFFRSMELSVRTFPPSLQIEAKQQIFAIVTRLEQRSLLPAAASQGQGPTSLQVTVPQNTDQNSAAQTIFPTYRRTQHNPFYGDILHHRNYGSHLTPTMVYPEQQQTQPENTLHNPDPTNFTNLTSL